MRARIAGPRGAGKPLEIAGKAAGHTTVGRDNEFPTPNLVLLHRPLVAEPGKDGAARGAVRRDGAGAIERPLFEVHRRSPPDGWQLHHDHVPVAEVPRRMSLRCGHRLAVDWGAVSTTSARKA